METTSTTTRARRKWAATEQSFGRLLAWLDEGTDSGGESYLSMRRKLVAYFDRKNCANPDDLADETLNRVGRRLEEEGGIETDSPAKYCYTIARYVFLESLRSPRAGEIALDVVTQNGREIAADESGRDEAEHRERMLSCLERCTASLEPGQREMILRYYSGDQRVKIENRRALAEEMGLSPNALTIRAYRIREKLERCVTECSCA